MVFSCIFVATLFPVLALAANNWTHPCHTGECQWDLRAEHSSGAIKLSGSHTSISDLTSAGGWTILDCDSTSADQDIRVVCHDPSKCDHLFQNGAENTLVRLPDDCSSEPFAVVTRVWDHDDQSVPASKRSSLEGRDGPQRPVQGINLSTDFAGTNSSQHGNVTVLIVGSSVHGINNITETVPGCNATDIISSAHGCNATSVALKMLDPLSKRSDSKSGTFTLPNKTIQKNLFNDSFACPQSGSVPAFNGKVSVDVKSTVTGTINYAVTFAGILSALKSSVLSVVVGFDASLDGTISLSADLVGSLSSGDVTLFTTGIPGLDFGSMLKIGPTFNIYAETDATIQTNLEMDVDLVYSITGGKLVFPPSQGSSSGGTFDSGKSNVKLSASPNVAANAQVAAHLKPTFEFGASILKQKADIFLELDASASLDLSLTGKASASASTGTGNSSGAGAGGCVDVLAGLAVNGGADADLLGIFKANDKVKVFSKSLDLFKKCLGSSAKRRGFPGLSGARRAPLSPFEQYRRSHYPRTMAGSRAAVERRRIVRKSTKGFTCPAPSLHGLAPIV